MKFNEITNLDTLKALDNAAELSLETKYKSREHAEKFIGLNIHRSGFYGQVMGDSVVPLERLDTIFDQTSDVVILIEGYVSLSKTPVNNGLGSIVYKGYGTLVIAGAVKYGGPTNSTPVTTGDSHEIQVGDWISDGVTGYYYDILHGLSTKNLFFTTRDVLGNEVVTPNGYTWNGVADELNKVRVTRTAGNNKHVFVSVTNGGSAVVTETITYAPDGEITADTSPTGKDGINTPVNSATDKTLTVDTGICGVGKIAYFTQKGVGRILYVSGTLNILPYAFGSSISGGVESITGVYNIDGVNCRIILEVQ